MATRKAPDTDDEELKSIIAWVEDSFEEVAADGADNIQTYQVAVSYNAPTRPRAGMLAYADGTKWNPGGGEGPYYYGSDNLWHLMKAMSNTFPLCRVERTTSSQTVTSAVPTKIQFNTVTFDLTSIWDPINFRIKPTVPGYYKVDGKLFISTTGVLNYGITDLYKNGSQLSIGTFFSPYNAVNNLSAVSEVIHMDGVNDYLEIFANTSGTGTITAVAGTGCIFSAILVKAD